MIHSEKGKTQLTSGEGLAALFADYACITKTLKDVAMKEGNMTEETACLLILGSVQDGLETNIEDLKKSKKPGGRKRGQKPSIT